MRAFRFVCFASLLMLALSSCNLPSLGAGPPVTYQVGASGNEVKYSDGAKVVVPQGSLRGDAQLSIAVSAESPPAVEGASALGKLYDIKLPAEMLFPLDIYLPLERKAGIPDSQYAALRWDGSYWTVLQGQVEGNTYRFTSDHTTLYRLHYWEAAHYPVEFYNTSMTKVHIRPWQYTTFIKYGAIGGILIDGRYPDGTSRGWGYLPPGEYTQWCVDWSEFTKPVWDIFGGGYWNEFLGNFHFFFNQRVLINRYSEIEMGEPNTARVRFGISAAMPGLCGQSPSLNNYDPRSPLREQPQPWTVLEPTRTDTPVRTTTPPVTTTPPRTNTPFVTTTPPRTNTPVRTATPVRTSTPVRTATPVRTNTPTLNFASFIIDSRHIDTLQAALIVLAHDGDFVLLRGPITVNYEYRHRPSAGAPVIIDPPIRNSCRTGET